ncbi:hypothetical protein BO78DRAFT_416919 [Aspergillus sclerotiicarbonarius CBS 121057]|uniref:Uncharacterized protein n=1 Tax=Aspergillus sclerotiicarbonarius (strain CBS 121057 / IBT 28362) TaxID=1448318 RepID=A0A319EF61_ASPSB|nr:hypothetical protein BO78DRAFT_416919 [Aspergillus sclerotiicarbonarius CBS 121057]
MSIENGSDHHSGHAAIFTRETVGWTLTGRRAMMDAGATGMWTVDCIIGHWMRDGTRLGYLQCPIGCYPPRWLGLNVETQERWSGGLWLERNIPFRLRKPILPQLLRLRNEESPPRRTPLTLATGKAGSLSPANPAAIPPWTSTSTSSRR